MKKIETETAKEWKSLYPSPLSDTLFLSLYETQPDQAASPGTEKRGGVRGGCYGWTGDGQGAGRCAPGLGRGLRNPLPRQEWSEGVNPISQGWGERGRGTEGLLPHEEVWESR